MGIFALLRKNFFGQGFIEIFLDFRLKRYFYIPYGIIVDEPLMFMSDLHWRHNGRFYIRGREVQVPEEGPNNWNTDFGQEIGGVTGIYDGGGGFF